MSEFKHRFWHTTVFFSAALILIVLGLLALVVEDSIGQTRSLQFIPDRIQLASPEPQLGASTEVTDRDLSSGFLYLPFDVVAGSPNYMATMSSVFDHSNPNYTKADQKIVMFNGGIFDDKCKSIDYEMNEIEGCKGNIQSFTDETWEHPRQYYNGHNGYDWAVAGNVKAASSLSEKG